MIEFSKSRSGGRGEQFQTKISVIGIGGAGSSVLDRIAIEDLVQAELINMNCDVRVLRASTVDTKLQLGRHVTQGLGAGGDPEVGFEAANATESEIEELVEGQDMVFLCAGLGGGTGCGASPLIAEIAKRAGAFVVAFVTMPFSFEGRRRVRQAREALERLKKHAHALIVFENNRMTQLVSPSDDIQKAFGAADLLLGQSIRAVSTIVRSPGMIRIGMDDLRTALKTDEARCLFGFGEASGENRASVALARALQSPLITPNQLLENSSNVLVHIAGGASLTLNEVESLMNELEAVIPEETQILFGAGVDERLGDRIAVTLISSVSSEALEDSDINPSYSKEASRPAPSVPALRQVTGRSETPSPRPQAKADPVSTPLESSGIQGDSRTKTISLRELSGAKKKPAKTAPPAVTTEALPGLDLDLQPVPTTKTPAAAEIPEPEEEPAPPAAVPSEPTPVSKIEAEEEIEEPADFLTESAEEAEIDSPKADSEESEEWMDEETEIEIVSSEIQEESIELDPEDTVESEDDIEEPAEVETAKAESTADVEIEDWDTVPDEIEDEEPEAEAAPDSLAAEDEDSEPDWSALNDDTEPATVVSSRPSQPLIRQSTPAQDANASLIRETPRPDRFAQGDPTVVDGEDLDVPTFLRLRGRNRPGS